MLPRLALPILVAALGLPPLLPAAAGAQRGDPSGYRTRIDTTVAFARDGVVQLDHLSGDVVVTAWDRPEARLRAWAEHADIDARIAPGRIVVSLNRVNGRNRVGDSRFELTVPVGTRVKAASVSGDVQVTGVRGEVEASSTSGAVTVRDVGALATAASVSGDVTVADVTGDVTATSVGGDVLVRDVTGDVRASTVSGAVSLRGVRARSVSATTTSGGVTFEGPLDRAGRYEFTSHSGTVTLLLPSSVGADLSIETFSGVLDTDFPVTMDAASRRGARPRSFELTLGSGGARVVAQSFSGDVLLKRAGPREP